MLTSVLCCFSAGSTAAKAITCTVQLKNNGNVRLGSIRSSLPGCQFTVLSPTQSVDCTITRLLTTDDFDVGNVTLAVQPATAVSYSVGAASVSSPGDSVVVALADRTAVLDLAFSAQPLTLANDGKREQGRVAWGAG